MANKDPCRQVVLTLGGLNSEMLLYLKFLHIDILLKDQFSTSLANYFFFYRELTESKYSFQMEDEEAVLDPRSLTPVERARSKKKISKVKPPPPTNVVQEVEYQGLKFPAQLDTPYAVAQVLNQEPGRLRAKDLRDGMFIQ